MLAAMSHTRLGKEARVGLSSDHFSSPRRLENARPTRAYNQRRMPPPSLRDRALQRLRCCWSALDPASAFALRATAGQARRKI